MSLAGRKFTFVAFREEGFRVAQCLDADLAAQAKSGRWGDLLYEVQRVLVGMVVIARETGRAPFDGLPETPKEYIRRASRTGANLVFAEVLADDEAADGSRNFVFRVSRGRTAAVAPWCVLTEPAEPPGGEA